MGSTLSVIKTLIVPAIIALLAFLLVSYVLVPLWQRYRARYSHYLPLDTISTSTTSLRYRVQSGVAGLFSPSRWRRWQLRGRGQDSLVAVAASDSASDDGRFGLGGDDDEEEGEELGSLGADRRAQLEREQARRGMEDPADVERRLSRDLEEGFRDDSEEEQELEPVRRAR